MSDSVSTLYGRADLNQDIANTIEEMGNVDYVQALREFFPSRNMTPREFAKHHLIKRRVKFEYVGLNEQIPVVCPPGWDLLVVSGVAFTRREVEDMEEKFEGIQTGERVLLGMPLNPMAVVPQLRELLALRRLDGCERYDNGTSLRANLENRRGFVHRQMVEKARKALVPASFRWFYQGKMVEDSPAGGRDYFVSGFLQTMYNCSPLLTLGCSQKDAVSALDELLDLTQPIQISGLRRKGGSKALLNLLVNTGLLVTDVDSGSYVSYKLADSISDPNWGRLWGFYRDSAIGDGRHVSEVELGKLTASLEAAPWGISLPVQAFLLAVLMRQVYPYLTLRLDGEPMMLAGRALLRALKNSKGWTLHYHPASTHEIAFLDKVMRVFALSDNSAFETANVWESALQAVRSWLATLPQICLLRPETMSDSTRKLVDLFAGDAPVEDLAELLGERLPEICGGDCIPLEEDQAVLIERLEECRDELQQREELFYKALYAELALVFGAQGGVESSQDLDRVCASWVRKLPEEVVVRNTSQESAILLNPEKLADSDERWLVAIPQKFGLPAVRKWQRDLCALYRARLARVKVELETSNVRELGLGQGVTEETAEKVTHWMLQMFAGLHLTPQERESVLLDLMVDMD